MQREERSSKHTYKRTNTQFQPFEPLDNLSKKRPSNTKLDIEKMYEQSLQLSSNYKQLLKENQQLQQQYQQIEAAKVNRQNLISTVQKLVEQKSRDLNAKKGNNFSWLVFKLNNKIYDLKSKIEAKDKAIREISLSKQSQIIRQKQTQLACLTQILQFAKSQGIQKSNRASKDRNNLSQIKEIVWMQQQIKDKQLQIIQAEKNYHQQQKKVKLLMQEMGRRKAELKSIKQMENQYNKAQDQYREQKKRKQQRIAGNKTYLQQLQNQRANQLKKLEQLKSKYSNIEMQEKKAIQTLKTQLGTLRQEHEEKLKIQKKTIEKQIKQQVTEKVKRQVKKITFDQIKLIGLNLNFSLKLKNITHKDIPNYFNEEDKEQYSIKQVHQILQNHPFSLNSHQALLLTRYVIQDPGNGYFFQDMDTSQSASIIRSILAKVIGQIKVYTRQEAEEYRVRIGRLMTKFGKLVQQSLDLKIISNRDVLKKGVIKQSDKLLCVSKQKMQQALQNTLSSIHNETFMHEQIQFTIFYLFSWSKNINELQFNRLFKMQQENVNWPSQ